MVGAKAKGKTKEKEEDTEPKQKKRKQETVEEEPPQKAKTTKSNNTTEANGTNKEGVGKEVVQSNKTIESKKPRPEIDEDATEPENEIEPQNAIEPENAGNAIEPGIENGTQNSNVDILSDSPSVYQHVIGVWGARTTPNSNNSLEIAVEWYPSLPPSPLSSLSPSLSLPLF
jgi:hypothetical protein